MISSLRRVPAHFRIDHRRTLYNAFEYEAGVIEDSATSSLPEMSETGTWVEKKLTVQVRSMIPAHLTINQAAQDFEDFSTEPRVKGLTSSKQRTPEDRRTGVYPSHKSKHDHGCDGTGPIPPNCTELALSLSTQPPGRTRPGLALEPPIVAQLTCTFADLPQVWAVASLLSHIGEVLLDKLEGKFVECAHPDTGEFRFSQLAINDPGKYRIRITLMQMDFSNGSHPDGVANVCEYIESDRILVDAGS